MAKVVYNEFEVKAFDCAPRNACHPECGTVCGRHSRRERILYDRGDRKLLLLLVVVGVYFCPSCGRYWSMQPDFARAHKRYANGARQALIDGVEQDRMPIRRVHQRMQRDFGLHPSVSSLMRWWREEAQSLDVAGYQAQVIGRFSGLLCIDEVYDGPWAILVATDPLQDRTVGYHLGTTANADDVEAFLRELRRRGLDPEMVMTDESSLYPKVLAKLWKKARHALCRFHVSQQFTKASLKVVKAIRNEMPKPKKRGRGRPKKRGRPRKDKEKREARAKVWKARFLFVKRYKKMSEEEKRELAEVIALWPRLEDARDFIDGWYGIFEGEPRPATARKRRDEFVARWSDSEHEPLAKRAQKLADDAFFGKLCAPLYYENAETTNNHPERDNRDYRKRQKTFFRMRSEKSIEALRRRQMTRKEVEDGPEQVLRQRFGRRAGQSVLTRVNTRPEAST